MIQFIEKEDIEKVQDFPFQYDGFTTYFSSRIRNEYLADFIICLFQSPNIDFVNFVLKSLKEKKFLFHSCVLELTLSKIYETTQHNRNVKIILDYAKSEHVQIELELKKLFVEAINRKDYNMLYFLHKNNLKCTIPLNDLIFVQGFNFDMLKFMVLELKYTYFDDLTYLNIVMKNLNDMCTSLTSHKKLENLIMIKYLYDKGGRKKVLLNNLENSFFSSYLCLQNRVEKRMANRIYFWIYPVLYRNKEFVLKQAERSYNSLFGSQIN